MGMKSLRQTLTLFLLFVTTFSFGQKLTVAAAANVQFVMGQLKKEFESATGIQVNVILNSSGNLTAQIKEGAPYDVFVSADMSYPLELYQKGFAAAPPRVYAYGALVLWTTRQDIHPASDLRILDSGIIKKIAIPNPRLAPYGVAAQEAMQYRDVFERVKNKLVYGESISQTNQYILSRSADIGFTAKSIVLANEMNGKGSWIDIDMKSYHPIEQGAVVLEHGRKTNKVASQKFYDYLYSTKAKAIFKKYGYITQ